MTTAQRREEILTLLNQADAPIAAKDLAARFGVSRQVIVQDLAVIRASRPNIISTNRGYILQQQETGCLREFKVRHTPEQAGQELNLIVDHGGRVKNISISHRVYGRITAEMDIRSRQDVQEFLQALAGGASTVLSTATDGYHYHLVEAATPDRLDLIGQALKDADFLAPLQPWEKEDSLRAIRFMGAEEGLQILLNHRKCGRDYLPEEVRHLRYLRLPFLTPPFDAGGRRGQENEAAEETEFFERIFREEALKKGRGTRQAAKEGGLWRNIRRRWERFMGGFPWQWK